MAKDIADDKSTVDDKGIGKVYNPNEFSQRASEAGSGKFMWIAAVVTVVMVVAISLYMFGPLGKNVRDSNGITAATINSYCVDSDGGYNRFTKGVTAGTSSTDYSENEFVDKCAGEENKLTEYYCKNDFVVYTTEPCPEGMTCTNGVCAT